MNEIQNAKNLTIDIEQFISTGVIPTGMSIGGLAEEYSKLYSDIHKRVEECLSYVDNGHYTEAVRLSETAPPLLDMIVALQFEKREQWLEYAKSASLSVPRSLDIKQIRKINDAYTKSDGIADIERNYRIAAVQCPPDLQGCIASLRRLRKVQPDVDYHQQDLGTFEKRRLGVIRKDFQTIISEYRKEVAGEDRLEKRIHSSEGSVLILKDASNFCIDEFDLNVILESNTPGKHLKNYRINLMNKKLKHLSSLYSELLEDWQEKEDVEKVRSEIEKGVKQIRSRHAATMESIIIQALEESYASYDYEKTKMSLEQHTRLLDEGFLVPSHDSIKKIKSIEEWCREEQNIREKSEDMRDAIARLSELTNEPEVNNLKELIKLHNYIFKTNLDQLYNVNLPPELAVEKVDSIINFLTKRTRNKKIIRNSAIAACFIFVILSCSILYYNWQVVKNSQFYIDKLTSVFEHKDINQFREYEEQLRESTYAKKILSISEVQKVLDRRNELEEEIINTKNNFEHQVEQLQNIASEKYLKDDEFLRILKDLHMIHTKYPVLRNNESYGNTLTNFETDRKNFWNLRIFEIERNIVEQTSGLNELLYLCKRNIFSSCTDLAQITNSIETLKINLKLNVNTAEEVSSVAMTLSLYDSFEKAEKALKEADFIINQSVKCAEICSQFKDVRNERDYLKKLYNYTKLFPESNKNKEFEIILSKEKYYDFLCEWKGLGNEKRSKNNTSIDSDNYLWYPIYQKYIRSFQLFDSIKDDIIVDSKVWGKDLNLVELYILRSQYSSGEYAFLLGDYYEAHPTSVLIYYEGDCYIPKASDSMPYFIKKELDARKYKKPELLPHCTYFKELIAQLNDSSKFKTPDDLLYYFNEIKDTQKLEQFPNLRMGMLKYFAKKITDLFGEGTPNQIVEFIEATDNKFNLPWLCVKNPLLKKEAKEEEELLNNIFADVDIKEEYNNETLFENICTVRGARWYGFVSPIDSSIVRFFNDLSEFWVLRSELDGGDMLIPVLASRDGKTFELELVPGEPLFGPASLLAKTTPSLRSLAESKFKRSIGIDELPMVWPREVKDIANAK